MSSSSMLARCAVLFLSVLLALTLHGCGGGGTTTTTAAPTPAPTTTTGTTATTTTHSSTTSTSHKQEVPEDARQAAKELNDLYMGWEKDNASTRYGVTLRFIQTGHVTEEGHHWFYCQDPCTQGYNDCRVSASLLNNQTMLCRGDCKVDQDDNSSLPAYARGAMHTKLAVAFNQTWVETEGGKCYYQFDGASTYRYNNGCACGALNEYQQTCKGDLSPFNNIDPKTEKQMDSNSDQVKDCHCGDGKLVPKVLPSKTTDSQCYWKGPAFDPNAASVNELSDMMKQRMGNQHGYDVVQDLNRSRLQFWNEVVIDGNVLTQQLSVAPQIAIHAIVWLKTGDNTVDKQTLDYAGKLAAYFQTEYGYTGPPPVVSLNEKTDVRHQGPFGTERPVPEESVIA